MGPSAKCALGFRQTSPWLPSSGPLTSAGNVTSQRIIGDLSPRDVPPDRPRGSMATESCTRTDCPISRPAPAPSGRSGARSVVSQPPYLRQQPRHVLPCVSNEVLISDARRHRAARDVHVRLIVIDSPDPDEVVATPVVAAFDVRPPRTFAGGGGSLLDRIQVFVRNWFLGHVARMPHLSADRQICVAVRAVPDRHIGRRPWSSEPRSPIWPPDSAQPDRRRGRPYQPIRRLPGGTGPSRRRRPPPCWRWTTVAWPGQGTFFQDGRP
jgi:hypothetical protein